MYFAKIVGLAVMVVALEKTTCAPLSKSHNTIQEDTDHDMTLTTPTPKHKVENKDDAAEFLKKFGYLNRKPGISKNNNNGEDDVREGIKKLQKWLNMNITGELDNDTLTIMNSPRCHLPDIITDPKVLRKRYNLVASWRKRKLTYRLLNYPASSTYFSGTSDIDATIDATVTDWTSIANIDISRVTNGYADINIGFYSGDHGDGDPFDKRGTVLAHAYYPENGRLHFDNDELWSKTNYGTNLHQVGTHEMGHILGLGHTNVFGSVMYPYYSFSKLFKLLPDDISGIVKLYGKKPNVVSLPSVIPPDFSTLPPTTTTRRVPWWRRWWPWS